MNSAKKWVNGAFIGLVLNTCLGCADWPRYQQETSVNNTALAPDQQPRDGISIDWFEIETNEEINDTLDDPRSLQMGEGFIIEGTLSGLGWSPDEDPDRISECGETRAFPPASPGNYTGDVDWFGVVPGDSSTLCMNLTTDVDSARLDVPLYLLDDCNEPTSVFVQNDTETPIGTDVNSAQIQWAIPVTADAPLAIGLAGFYPDDNELSVDWVMHLALVPSVENAGSALCPEVNQ